jgi:hypothetical protein
MQHPDQPIRTDQASTNGRSPNGLPNPDTASAKSAPVANSNFDALDYARIASVPHPNSQGNSQNLASSQNRSDPISIENVTSETLTSKDFEAPYGELDPYVDPAELMNKTTTQTPTPDAVDLANQALEKLQGFEQALLANEVSSESRLTSPAVEIIAGNDKAASTKQVGASNLVDDAVDSELELATAPTASQATAIVPIVNQESGEAVFDVRDFSDSADGTIEMIPNAFEVDPETFDYETADESQKGMRAQASQSEVYVNPIDDGQIFVAGTGDVIEVNGNDGFDHIDLACFDVECATISEQVIKIDDQQGASFEVRFQDVNYALFADGVEVRLN